MTSSRGHSRGRKLRKETKSNNVVRKFLDKEQFKHYEKLLVLKVQNIEHCRI